MSEAEDPRSIAFPCLRVRQPIGEFYVGVIPAGELCSITYFDVRRMMRRGDGLETYLGIQRPLEPRRVTELKEYVKTTDACFPTAIILAVPDVCAAYDESSQKMTLSNVPSSDLDSAVLYRDIARVLDGQHRIEGLSEFSGTFDVSVSIFVDADISEQAYIFSTVNLAQTKVNRSLVYDLFDLAKTRSPQKVCHNIAVALDSHEKSPFFQRIKRLGRATDGRRGETITQACFVSSLMRYISKAELADRDLYLRNKLPLRASVDEERQLIFRNMMLDNRDIDITDVLWNFFEAVQRRWPSAWSTDSRGKMLNTAAGFRGLMRFLRDLYLVLGSAGNVPSTEAFLKLLLQTNIDDDDLSVDKFNYGSGGETELYRLLLGKSKIPRT